MCCSKLQFTLGNTFLIYDSLVCSIPRVFLLPFIWFLVAKYFSIHKFACAFYPQIATWYRTWSRDTKKRKLCKCLETMRGEGNEVNEPSINLWFIISLSSIRLIAFQRFWIEISKHHMCGNWTPTTAQGMMMKYCCSSRTFFIENLCDVCLYTKAHSNESYRHFQPTLNSTCCLFILFVIELDMLWPFAICSTLLVSYS